MDDPLEFLHGLLSFKLLPEGPFSCQRGGGGSIQMLRRCFPCLHGQRRKGDVERGERKERAKLL